VERLLKHGFKVAALSNYGLEGKIETVQAKNGKYTHFPKGYKPYSEDAIPVWHEQHKSQYPNLRDALITLYDVWVYNDMKFDGDIFAWTPLDHVTLPPQVLRFLLRDNVTPLSMSPHGKRQLDKAGIDNVYIPHGIDTKVMKPTKDVFGVPTREYLDVPEDAFLVGIFAANKANGLVHRKAFAENLFAFAKFREENPDAYLYIHAEPSNAFGGFQLINLIKAVGLDDTCVRILNTDVNRTGYPAEAVAAFMSACDVILSTSYGEGFGVPQVEAQACGTRVITSSWAASPDLAGEDSFLVAGQPFWDEPQQSFYNIPHIPSIIEALREAYKMPRGTSLVSVDFAKQFDVDLVWNWYWLPFLRDRFHSA
jgi:glycosyltransferase involved in cell wall biosynthesis